MSLTTTVQRSVPTTTSIILSPAKRRKFDSEELPATNEPTTADLYRWTFKRESIAPCFVQDVFSMTEHADKEDFFWLGRVPCRTVRIVGLVVGVQVYEKRVRYTVDDGTAVVDCLHRQAQAQPPKTPTKKGNIQVRPISLPLPKLVARVGVPVCVVGRVVRKFQTREVAVDSIELCSSSNDESRHWLEVHRLHKIHYSLSTPFRIPEPTSLSRPSSPTKAPMRNISPAKVAIPRTPAPHEPTTPSTVLSMASTAFSTPFTASSTPSSPSKSVTSQAMSPQRLRHPSRLHSRDLNGNTFRIYVKHYMDRMAMAPRPNPPADDSDSESDSNALSECLATPTKRRHATALCDETPRPGSSKASAFTRTPRPRIQRLSFGGPSPLPSRPASNAATADEDPTMAGFTLSYLRRAPELADMAKRVVKAVAKRRLREERKKAKEAAAAAVPPSACPPPRPSKSQSQAEDAAKLGPRVKRLFQSTIVQLLREGSIVLWDGPVRSCLPSLHLSEGQAQIPEDSWLWKANVTSVSADSTVFSSVSGTSVEEDEEELELSDPEEGEEAYVPISPRFLSVVVEEAIRKLAKVRPHGITSKGRGQAAGSGATKESILAYLMKDDRWRYLSEWNVAEALDMLKGEGMVRCTGNERWELTS